MAVEIVSSADSEPVQIVRQSGSGGSQAVVVVRHLGGFGELLCSLVERVEREHALCGASDAETIEERGVTTMAARS